MKCTRQRCQVALSTLETAALMPSWLSLMTSFTPRNPRRLRLRRNSVQNGSASLAPTFSPNTSRCPSVLTPTNNLDRGPPPSTSFVLSKIDPAKQPEETVACRTCPMALWMVRASEVECYCRAMYQIVWNRHKTGKVTMCDGPSMVAQEAENVTDKPSQDEFL